MILSPGLKNNSFDFAVKSPHSRSVIL